MRIAHASVAIERYVEAFNMRDFLNDDLLRHLQLFRFPPIPTSTSRSRSSTSSTSSLRGRCSAATIWRTAGWP